MKPELMDGVPPGAWAECQSNRSIQKELFVVWLKKFIESSGAKISSPVLLILERYKSNIKSNELINIARERMV